MLKAAAPRDKALAFFVGLPIFLVIGIFYFGFLSFHFGFFHYIHGIFLDSFFPLDGIKASKGNHYIGKIPLVLKATWPFILFSVISHRNDILGGMNQKNGPYRNVIKMHLMIICFFGPAAIFKWNHFLIYVGVLLVYFFPWHIVSELKSKGNGDDGNLNSENQTIL